MLMVFPRICSLLFVSLTLSSSTYWASSYACYPIYWQAIKDDVGTVRIQRPHKGPFYISPKTIDQLITNLGKWARYWLPYILILHYAPCPCITGYVSGGINMLLWASLSLVSIWLQNMLLNIFLKESVAGRSKNGMTNCGY